MPDTATAALTTPPGVNSVGYHIGYYAAPVLIGVAIVIAIIAAIVISRRRTVTS